MTPSEHASNMRSKGYVEISSGVWERPRFLPPVPGEPDRVAGVPVDKESELHEDIMQECVNRGWMFFHGSMARKTSRTIGEPDFTIVAHQGRVFFIEAKAKGGKLTTEQRAIGVAMQVLEQRYKVVYCLEDFVNFVDKNAC